MKPSPNPKIDISIIIVSYNTVKLTLNCLKSLEKSLQNSSLKAEILVVDNASTDSSPQKIKKNFPQVKLIENKKNQGFAYANNQAAKKAQGQYLFLLNSDTLVPQGSLEKMIKFAATQTQLGILAPRLLNSDGSVQYSCFPPQTPAAAFGKFFLGQKNSLSQYAPPGEIPTIVFSAVGAALLIPRPVWQKLGGFEEKYFMYFEDLDLCRRAQKAGLKVYYFPSATITHLHGQSAKKEKQKPNLWLNNSSKIYHGLFKHYLINLILFWGQKWGRLWKKNTLKKLLFFSFLLRLFLLLISSCHPDILNHLDWGERFWFYGAKNFYEGNFWGVSWPNQPIASIFLFALINKLYHLIFAALWWLNLNLSFFPSFIFPFLEQKLPIILFKLPFVLSDLGLGLLIYRISLHLTKQKTKALLAASLFLLNPVLIYNSSIWGQTDSLINFLTLFGLWQAYRGRYFKGLFAFALSLFFKLSLFIWSPILFLILLSQKKSKVKILFNIFLVFLVLLIFALPFVHHGNVLTWLWYLFTNRILARQGNMLSGNAFNLWTLIYGINLSLKENTTLFLFSAKTVGLTLSSLLLIPIFAKTLKKIKSLDFTDYLFLCFFTSFTVFLFFTNMHERYLYPVFAPLAILTALKKSPLNLSFVHLLNLYNLWYYPLFSPLKNLLEFQNFLLPRLLSALLLGIFAYTYVKYFKKGRLL